MPFCGCVNDAISPIYNANIFREERMYYASSRYLNFVEVFARTCIWTKARHREIPILILSILRCYKQQLSDRLLTTIKIL